MAPRALECGGRAKRACRAVASRRRDTALGGFASIDYDGPSLFMRESAVDSVALASKGANSQSGVPPSRGYGAAGALRLPPQSKLPTWLIRLRPVSGTAGTAVATTIGSCGLEKSKRALARINAPRLLLN